MLTDIAIRNLPPVEGQAKKADGEGLFLHLQGKRRTWRMAYRFAGKQRTITFGEYPDVSLTEARRRRDAAKALLDAHVDPVVHAQQEAARAVVAAATTFEMVGKEWQAKRSKEELSHSAHRKDAQMLDGHAYPVLGPRAISSITAPEILAMIRDVEARGNYDTAHRLRSTVSRVFRYAIATGRCERDPAGDLADALVQKTVEHHAALFDPKEIGGLMRAIGGYTGEVVTRIAMQMQAHTFVRPGNLRTAEWKDFDLVELRWTLTEGKMKMKRKFLVPLSAHVVALLEELHPLTGSGRYLFPSVRGRQRPMSDMTVNAALRRLGYTKDEVVGHGFRRTASTILNESGLFRSDVVERQLAHVDGSVRGIYNAAEYWPERVALMTWWSNWLEAQRVGEVDPLAAVLG